MIDLLFGTSAPSAEFLQTNFRRMIVSRDITTESFFLATNGLPYAIELFDLTVLDTLVPITMNSDYCITDLDAGHVPDLVDNENVEDAFHSGMTVLGS
jgi:hypothetical protein